MHDVTGQGPVRIEVGVPGRGIFSQLKWGDDPAKPLLHFAHATGFNAGTYKVLLEPLAEHFRILATDLRGHGFTSAEADPAKLKVWSVYADDLVALADQIGEPMIMSGHSMGGAVSLMTAAERPELVKGLVLADPVMIPYKQVFAMRWRRFRGAPTSPLAAGAKRRRAVFESRDAMVERYTGRGAFTTWPVEMIRDYVEGGTRDIDDGKVELTCAPAWEGGTFESAGGRMSRVVARVKCPTTILHAEFESTLRGGMIQMIHKLQPNWEVRQLDGSSHFLVMERPQAIRDAILKMARLTTT